MSFKHLQRQLHYFLLKSITLMNYINQCLPTQLFLPSWNKPHLILVFSSNVPLAFCLIISYFRFL